MEVYVLNILPISLLVLLICGVAKVSYSIWWKPKWLERNLKRQGIRGTPYKPLVGDMKEYIRLISEAWSKPLSLAHQIIPRVDPFTMNNFQKYGTNYTLPPNGHCNFLLHICSMNLYIMYVNVHYAVSF